MQLKILESNIGSSVLGTLFLIKSLKISDLIFNAIFCQPFVNRAQN